jgi:hypothetical protein
MSTILFPLRTSVELFEDRRSPQVVTRAKEAALLYDRLIFEEGLYDIAVTSNGLIDLWLPPDDISPEHLERSREPIPEGTPIQLLIHREAHLGGPPVGEGQVLLEGPVGVQYVSELHTGILNELEQFKPDWAESVAIGGAIDPWSPIGRAIGELIARDSGDKTLMPDLDKPRRGFIYKAFNRDSVVAGHFRAAFSITSLFRPMVERRGIVPDRAGSEALDLLVPNVGALPWEAVVEWRDHPGSQEARAKLREFEERAARAEPEEAQDFLRQVDREVVDGLLAAYSELLPSLPEELQKEVAKTFIAFIPGVGPFIEKGTTVAEIVGEAVANRRSWVAAMMWLRARS